MDAEEAQEGTVSREKELEILKQESEIPIEELLENLPPEMLEDRSEESGSEESDESPDEEESEPSKYELFSDKLLCFIEAMTSLLVRKELHVSHCMNLVEVLHLLAFCGQLVCICDRPRENQQKGDDTGTLF